MAALGALKKDLRKKIKKVLADVSDASAASQTSNAVGALLGMPEYKAARWISVYLSMPTGEIATTKIIRDALSHGKTVFIPYTYNLEAPGEGQPNSIMDMVELCSMQDFESLQPDKWNIPTPSEDSIANRTNSFGGKGATNGTIRPASEHAGLDLIVMPGMAFDLNFGRLGHGKGFYDYFLRRCHDASRVPFRVGLALTEQLLPPTDAVPMDKSDFRLDALITGDGELRRA
ncbi:hypothetical protein SLS60_007828 [Paraconiothyrium brasiliense]|uniref:5-formyltetrahydrofolate cyclo-ligase n=1 Tax=Paraconiothyrium brasiliense TaxID=300254 RepID=A0ABR3R2P3_9PLEO